MDMETPELLIFASGGKDPKSGGSGFEQLVLASRSGILRAKIVGVVSNHEHGGVRERADRLGVRFIHFPKPWTGERYEQILKDSGAQWVALSGWLKLVVVRRLGFSGFLARLFGKNRGLDPRRTFNIHPALLSALHGIFGGSGMYGYHVHEAVKKELDAGQMSESGFTMHFVTAEYDQGPTIYEYRVPLTPGMSAQEIGAAVNAAEHKFQPIITDDVIHGRISWDGKNPRSLRVPPGYTPTIHTLGA